MPYTKSLLAGLLAIAAGCGNESADAPTVVHANLTRSEGAPNVPTQGVDLDSIFPMDTMIARFQAELPAVTSLGTDAPGSMDELVGRFIAAVAERSVPDLRALTMNAAEFAYLYFPTSIYSREPYAQPPAVTWLLLEQNSLKGETRLLREYGGRSIAVRGYRCQAEPRVEGENRIWEQCLVNLGTGTGDTAEVRLFGSIIERGGRYKVMSLANRI